MPGYSGTPLARKLGIRPEARVALFRAPRGIEGTLEGLPGGVRPLRDPRAGTFDVGVLFCAERAVLERRIAGLTKRLAEDGGLWIAWPKKASGVETDVTDALVRATGLAAGLVDNKVCAIDDTWSGLRFVRRLRDRRKKA